MNMQPSSESGSTQRSEPDSGACQTLVLYDGQCPFCRKQMARLRKWDKEGTLRLLPYQEPWVVEQFPHIDARALQRAMHVVTSDGAIHVGGNAVALIIEQVARPRVLRVLPRLPGVRQVMRWVYPMVADRRRRDESRRCTDATCEAPMAGGETFEGDRGTNDLTPQGRRTRLGFSIAFMVVVLSPVIQNWRDDPEDGFPLSYYPMFSHERGETYRLYHPVGITGDGQRVPIAYGRIGSGGFNAVRRQVREMARSGNKERLQEYTATIADSVAASKSRSLRDVDEVRIVRGTYNIDDWFLHGINLPERERTVSSAPVLRTNSASSSEKREGNKQ